MNSQNNNRTKDCRGFRPMAAGAFFLIACLFWITPAPVLAGKSVVEENGRYRGVADDMAMVMIPAGEIFLGSNVGAYDERPLHKVRLDAFLMDVHEVTNAQFEKFIKETGYVPQGPWRRGFEKGRDRLPVRFVTWNDAVAYAEWAGRRLPTEAEWERAAQGPKGRVYPWGDDWTPEMVRPDAKGPSPVGGNPLDVSPEGCRDMGGNVWEWTQDWYDRYYYESLSDRTAINPQGPEDGAEPEKRFVDSGTAAGNERSTRKVIKSGAGWGATERFVRDNMRVSRRMWGNPAYWLNDTGFRCAASASILE